MLEAIGTHRHGAIADSTNRTGKAHRDLERFTLGYVRRGRLVPHHQRSPCPPTALLGRARLVTQIEILPVLPLSSVRT